MPAPNMPRYLTHPLITMRTLMYFMATAHIVFFAPGALAARSSIDFLATHSRSVSP